MQEIFLFEYIYLFIFIFFFNFFMEKMKEDSFGKKKKKRNRIFINKKKSLYPKIEYLLYKIKFYPKVKENNRDDQNQKLKKYSKKSPFIFSFEEK